MQLTLIAPIDVPIPMNKMKPGQFAWCKEANTIVFATWRAGEEGQEDSNFVALNREGSTWGKSATVPVRLLPPGTQVRLEE